MEPRKKTTTNRDYDGDGIRGSATDRALAKKDTNKDGRVTPREERQAAERKRRSNVSTTVTKFDAQGRPTTATTRTPTQQEEAKGKSAKDYGVSASFLQKYPDMVEFVKNASDNNYEPPRFMAELENTTFGKERTAAQEAFDIAIEGPQSEDLMKKVNDRISTLRNEFMQAGIQISDQELNRYGREVVRSDLSNEDVLTFLSSQFVLPGAGERQGLTGVSSQVYSSLMDMAKQYGLTMSDQTMQSNVRTALAQGPNWQSWVEGQRNVFREQAKMQYPSLGDRLNDYTMEQLLDPYMNDAAELLGLNKADMNVMDPSWQRALQGPNGPLSRDEWIRTLRTDPKYGWDRTVRARQEYSYLADELLSVFGMA